MCSWSSADRRCSNYIWVIDSFIAYLGSSYIRGFTVMPKFQPCSIQTWPQGGLSLLPSLKVSTTRNLALAAPPIPWYIHEECSQNDRQKIEHNVATWHQKLTSVQQVALQLTAHTMIDHQKWQLQLCKWNFSVHVQNAIFNENPHEN